jgi:hypothetical protein
MAHVRYIIECLLFYDLTTLWILGQKFDEDTIKMKNHAIHLIYVFLRKKSRTLILIEGVIIFFQECTYHVCIFVA